MSMNVVIKATCPDCKKEFPFEMWQTVNIQLNPELRKKVLDHSIFNFKCPHCGMEGHTEYPFLYNDMQHGFMIQYCPEEEDIGEYEESLQKIIDSYKATGALNNEYIRIVTEYFLLEEKIKIFESGYDDRVIELLKAQEIKELNTNKPENHLAFALFELRTHQHLSPKEPIPTLVYINEDGKEVFDCPIKIIPGAVGKVKDTYNYLDDKSFEVDINWANKYVYTEKISNNFFDVDFNPEEISKEGASIVNGLLDLIKDNNTKNEIIDSLNKTENEILAVSDIANKTTIFNTLQAFYRYTNFKSALEEIRRASIFPWREQLGFLFDQIDMNEFFTVYFNVTNQLFNVLGVYFIKALIHGAKFDPNYPFDFTVESRDRSIGSLGIHWSSQLNGEKENDTKVLKEYYNDKKENTWALSVKNMCVRYIYQFDLPEDDPLRFDPLVTDDMWEKYKLIQSAVYDKLHDTSATQEEKEEILKMSLDYVKEIWKVSFTKYDIGRCFEEFAGYFYTMAFFNNDLYRKAYINQVISSAYRPNRFGMMYIKKQYKDDISGNEFKTYEIETGLPIHASEELHELIFERFKECEQKEDKYGQVYYLNLLYNYHDENGKEPLVIDKRLNKLLRQIEL